MPIDDRRLKSANQALRTFAPALHFARYRGRLYLEQRHQDLSPVVLPAMLRGDGSWPKYWDKYAHGGTAGQAVAQLIRFIRDSTRQPLKVWLYWTSDSIGLGDQTTVGILQKAGYADPAKVCCVLCGAELEQRASDWWSQGAGKNKVAGPCCWRSPECGQGTKDGQGSGAEPKGS